jgi:transposase
MNRKSRGSVILKEELSEEFEWTLVTYFYASYKVYLGEKQRCWVHFVRDLEALAEKNPDVPDVGVWVDSVMAVYNRAKDTVAKNYSDRERSGLRRRFQKELLKLAKPYSKDYTAPQRVLAKRIENFTSELFVFVQYPRVPSENNAAERAIRSAVVARKISGGTRSAKGSKTVSILRSLFETWNLQERNTIDACREMLIAHNRQALLNVK